MTEQEPNELTDEKVSIAAFAGKENARNGVFETLPWSAAQAPNADSTVNAIHPTTGGNVPRNVAQFALNPAGKVGDLSRLGSMERRMQQPMEDVGMVVVNDRRFVARVDTMTSADGYYPAASSSRHHDRCAHGGANPSQRRDPEEVREIAPRTDYSQRMEYDDGRALMGGVMRSVQGGEVACNQDGNTLRGTGLFGTKEYSGEHTGTVDRSIIKRTSMPRTERATTECHGTAAQADDVVASTPAELAPSDALGPISLVFAKQGAAQAPDTHRTTAATAAPKARRLGYEAHERAGATEATEATSGPRSGATLMPRGNKRTSAPHSARYDSQDTASLVPSTAVLRGNKGLPGLERRGPRPVSAQPAGRVAMESTPPTRKPELVAVGPRHRDTDTAFQGGHGETEAAGPSRLRDNAHSYARPRTVAVAPRALPGVEEHTRSEPTNVDRPRTADHGGAHHPGTAPEHAPARARRVHVPHAAQAHGAASVALPVGAPLPESTKPEQARAPRQCAGRGDAPEIAPRPVHAPGARTARGRSLSDRAPADGDEFDFEESVPGTVQLTGDLANAARVGMVDRGVGVVRILPATALPVPLGQPS